jgi:hypothetical protein
MHGWRYENEDDPLFESGLRRALALFDHAKLRATLFVIAEDLESPRKRALIQEAVKRGHEIASHSLTHRRLTTLGHDEKRREIFESRERIASTLGVEVRGFRAPGFYIDRECLELIEAADYFYDSSLFPNKKCCRKVGAARLSQLPHHPIVQQPLFELPLPEYAPLPVPFHPCYSLVLGSWYFRLGLRRFTRLCAPLVLLFHLTDLADPLPNDRLHSRRAKLYTLSHISAKRKYRKCEQMLELVRREYDIVNTTALLTGYTDSKLSEASSHLTEP